MAKSAKLTCRVDWPKSKFLCSATPGRGSLDFPVKASNLRVVPIEIARIWRFQDRETHSSDTPQELDESIAIAAQSAASASPPASATSSAGKVCKTSWLANGLGFTGYPMWLARFLCGHAFVCGLKGKPICGRHLKKDTSTCCLEQGAEQSEYDWEPCGGNQREARRTQTRPEFH